MPSHAEAEANRPSEVTPPIRPRAPWGITNVEALPDFRLRVWFNDGTEGIADLSALINSDEAGVFAALRDETLFRQARLSLGAATWPGDLDLAPDAMHRAIKECGTWIA